ncbi:MAG: response regulator receiver domain [Sterolibacterium sp.]
MQTAVFIDDKIYDRRPVTPAVPAPLVSPATKREPALKSTAKKVTSTSRAKSGDAGSSANLEEPFVPQDIVASFAKKRIVCSLYQPKKEASVGANSDVYPLCLASDIVIVDWDLYGDAGRRALELVTNLICQSLEEVPEQLRLVMVYTQEPNLFKVANDIYEKLNERIPNVVQPPTENALSLHSLNSRVAILGKPGTRQAEYKPAEVKEKELADRAITEFTQLASGLLQGAVLLGLAEIRLNSRKVLSKFDASLDPAFLTHRAFSLPHEDAYDHVIPLLTDEIRSLLEDCAPNPIITADLIEDWCKNVWQPSAKAKTFLGKIDAHEFAKEFCITGPEIKAKYGDSKKELKPLISDDKSWNPKGNSQSIFKELASLLVSEKDPTTNQRLAVLMSHRTPYGDFPRKLQLGTIVRHKLGGQLQYLLCLQPICDSVRVKEADRTFVFCKLQAVVQTGGVAKKNHVVFDGTTYVDLQFSPKSFHCVAENFAPDHGVVAAEKKGEANWIFKSVDGAFYEWLGQLKPDHAQRAAEQFASQLSRVGLTESEWLRLSAK